MEARSSILNEDTKNRTTCTMMNCARLCCLCHGRVDLRFSCTHSCEWSSSSSNCGNCENCQGVSWQWVKLNGIWTRTNEGWQDRIYESEFFASTVHSVEFYRHDDFLRPPFTALNFIGTNLAIWSWIKKLTCLRSLHLTSGKIQKWPANFVLPASLEILHLRGWDLNKSAINTLRFVHQLKELCLSGCTGVDAIPIQAIASVLTLPKSHTKLDVSQSTQFHKDLEKIYWSGCSSSFLKSFFSLKHTLHTMELSNSILTLDVFDHLNDVKNLTLRSCEPLPSSVWGLRGLKSLILIDMKFESSQLGEISQLQSMEQLTLTECPNFGELPEAVGLLTSVQSICLHNCRHLKALPSGIGNLPQLKSLSLKGCSGLEQLPRALAWCASLTALDLKDCTSLGALPRYAAAPELYLPANAAISSEGECRASFKRATRIKIGGGGRHVLRDCIRMMELPSSLAELTLLHTRVDFSEIRRCGNLGTLVIEKCASLKSLPGEVWSLPSLTTLKIEDCSSMRQLSGTYWGRMKSEVVEFSLKGCSELAYLPDFIGTVDSLKQIDLQGCTALRVLPDSLTKLTRLSSLALMGCTSLRQIQAQLGARLPSGADREQLCLRGCSGLRSLPTSLCDIEGLGVINLDGCCSIESLPHSFGSSLKHLRVLSLAGCRSLVILNLENLPCVREINLDGCCSLKSLALHRCYDLRELSLSGLTEILLIDLSLCSKLERLPLSLCSTKNLKHLNLQGCCRLKSVPDIRNLENLAHLNILSCAQLDSLPASMSSLKKLKTIRMDSQHKIVPCYLSITHLCLDCCLDQDQAVAPALGRADAQHVWTHGFKQLRSLYIQRWSILKADFRFPTTLHSLAIVDSDALVEIPDSISTLRNLCFLNLQKCTKLRCISSSIGTLTRLRSLNLAQCCTIKSLPVEAIVAEFVVPNTCLHCVIQGQSAPQGRKLCHLRLKGSSSQFAGDVIGNSQAVSNLESLLLEDVPCEGLPETIFASLKNLTRISILNCVSFSKIPSSLSSLKSLRNLTISGSDSLKTIDALIADLPLYSLSLDQCRKLCALPLFTNKLLELRFITLKKCDGLRELNPSIGNLLKLQSLEVTECSGLRYLPPSIGTLTQLYCLCLTCCNCLTEIPDVFGNLEKLTSLSVMNCPMIFELPKSIAGAKNLRTLNLGGCCSLRQLPSSISKLKSLKSFSWDHLSIFVKVPSEIGYVRNGNTFVLKSGSSLNKLVSQMGYLDLISSIKPESATSSKCIPCMQCPGFLAAAGLRSRGWNIASQGVSSQAALSPVADLKLARVVLLDELKNTDEFDFDNRGSRGGYNRVLNLNRAERVVRACVDGGTSSAILCGSSPCVTPDNYFAMVEKVLALIPRILGDRETLVCALSLARLARALISVYHTVSSQEQQRLLLAWSRKRYPTASETFSKLRNEWKNLVRAAKEAIIFQSEFFRSDGVPLPLLDAHLTSLLTVISAMPNPGPSERVEALALAGKMALNITEAVLTHGTSGLAGIFEAFKTGIKMAKDKVERVNASRIFTTSSSVESAMTEIERRLDGRKEWDSVEIDDIKRRIKSLQQFVLQTDVSSQGAITFAMCLTNLLLGPAQGSLTRPIPAQRSGERLIRAATLPFDVIKWILQGDDAERVSNDSNDQGEKAGWSDQSGQSKVRFMGISGLASFGDDRWRKPQRGVKSPNMIPVCALSIETKELGKKYLSQLISDNGIDLDDLRQDLQKIINGEHEDGLARIKFKMESGLQKIRGAIEGRINTAGKSRKADFSQVTTKIICQRLSELLDFVDILEDADSYPDFHVDSVSWDEICRIKKKSLLPQFSRLSKLNDKDRLAQVNTRMEADKQNREKKLRAIEVCVSLCIPPEVDSRTAQCLSNMLGAALQVQDSIQGELKGSLERLGQTIQIVDSMLHTLVSISCTLAMMSNIMIGQEIKTDIPLGLKSETHTNAKAKTASPETEMKNILSTLDNENGQKKEAGSGPESSLPADQELKATMTNVSTSSNPARPIPPSPLKGSIMSATIGDISSTSPPRITPESSAAGSAQPIEHSKSLRCANDEGGEGVLAASAGMENQPAGVFPNNARSDATSQPQSAARSTLDSAATVNQAPIAVLLNQKEQRDSSSTPSGKFPLEIAEMASQIDGKLLKLFPQAKTPIHEYDYNNLRLKLRDALSRALEMSLADNPTSSPMNIKAAVASDPYIRWLIDSLIDLRICLSRLRNVLSTANALAKNPSEAGPGREQLPKSPVLAERPDDLSVGSGKSPEAVNTKSMGAGTVGNSCELGSVPLQRQLKEVFQSAIAAHEALSCLELVRQAISGMEFQPISVIICRRLEHSRGNTVTKGTEETGPDMRGQSPGEEKGQQTLPLRHSEISAVESNDGMEGPAAEDRALPHYSKEVSFSQGGSGEQAAPKKDSDSAEDGVQPNSGSKGPAAEPFKLAERTELTMFNSGSSRYIMAEYMDSAKRLRLQMTTDGWKAAEPGQGKNTYDIESSGSDHAELFTREIEISATSKSETIVLACSPVKLSLSVKQVFNGVLKDEVREALREALSEHFINVEVRMTSNLITVFRSVTSPMLPKFEIPGEFRMPDFNPGHLKDLIDCDVPDIDIGGQALQAMFDASKSVLAIGKSFSTNRLADAWRVRAVTAHLLMQIKCGLADVMSNRPSEASADLKGALCSVQEVLAERKVYEVHPSVKASFGTDEFALEAFRFQMSLWTDPAQEDAESQSQASAIIDKIVKERDPAVVDTLIGRLQAIEAGRSRKSKHSMTSGNQILIRCTKDLARMYDEGLNKILANASEQAKTKARQNLDQRVQEIKDTVVHLSNENLPTFEDPWRKLEGWDNILLTVTSCCREGMLLDLRLQNFDEKEADVGKLRGDVDNMHNDLQKQIEDCKGGNKALDGNEKDGKEQKELVQWKAASEATIIALNDSVSDLDRTLLGLERSYYQEQFCNMRNRLLLEIQGSTVRPVAASEDVILLKVMEKIGKTLEMGFSLSDNQIRAQIQLQEEVKREMQSVSSKFDGIAAFHKTEMAELKSITLHNHDVGRRLCSVLETSLPALEDVTSEYCKLLRVALEDQMTNSHLVVSIQSIAAALESFTTVQSAVSTRLQAVSKGLNNMIEKLDSVGAHAEDSGKEVREQLSSFLGSALPVVEAFVQCVGLLKTEIDSDGSGCDAAMNDVMAMIKQFNDENISRRQMEIGWQETLGKELQALGIKVDSLVQKDVAQQLLSLIKASNQFGEDLGCMLGTMIPLFEKVTADYASMLQEYSKRLQDEECTSGRKVKEMVVQALQEEIQPMLKSFFGSKLDDLMRAMDIARGAGIDSRLVLRSVLPSLSVALGEVVDLLQGVQMQQSILLGTVQELRPDLRALSTNNIEWRCEVDGKLQTISTETAHIANTLGEQFPSLLAKFEANEKATKVIAEVMQCMLSEFAEMLKEYIDLGNFQLKEQQGIRNSMEANQRDLSIALKNVSAEIVTQRRLESVTRQLVESMLLPAVRNMRRLVFDVEERLWETLNMAKENSKAMMKVRTILDQRSNDLLSCQENTSRFIEDQIPTIFFKCMGDVKLHLNRIDAEMQSELKHMYSLMHEYKLHAHAAEAGAAHRSGWGGPQEMRAPGLLPNGAAGPDWSSGYYESAGKSAVRSVHASVCVKAAVAPNTNQQVF
jgi:Leucine-rich repeat (LRR) protein